MARSKGKTVSETTLEQLRDASKEEELVPFVQDLYKEEKDRKLPFSIQWYYNLAFLLGHQWTNVSSLGELVKVPEAPEHRVHRTENEILPRVKRIVSKATLDPPIMECIPMTGDDSDENAAKAGSEFLEFHQYEQDFQTLDVRALIYAQCCSKGFYKTTWNPTTGPLVVRPKTEIQDIPTLELDAEGEIVTQKQEVPVYDDDDLPVIDSFHLGEIDVVVCSPFECFPIGKGDRLRDKGITAFMHVVPRSVIHVHDVYDVWVTADKDARDTDDVYRDMAEQLGTLAGGDLTSSEDKRDQEPSVLVYEYWEKPTTEHPRGRLIVVAGGKLLKNDEMPYDHLEIPFAEIEDFPVPGRFWPVTMVEQAIPIQKEINVLASKIEEHTCVNAFPKLFRFQGDGMEVPWTNEAGQEIMLNSRQTMPESWDPPQLSQDVYKRTDMLREHLDDIFSTHAASKGQAPTGVKSGVAIAFLLEQDDTQHGPLFRSYHRARETVGRHSIALAKQFYDEPRKIKVLGESKRWVTKDFEASDIMSVSDVRVRQRSSVPMSHAGAMQKVFDIAQTFPQFYMDPMTGTMDYARLSEDLKVPSVQVMYERQLVDYEQAKRENEKMGNGEMPNVMSELTQDPEQSGPIPHFYDNHAVHYREHTRYMKTAEFEVLGPQFKMLFQQHVQAHGQILSQMQPQQPQAQLPAQGREAQQQSVAQQQGAQQL